MKYRITIAIIVPLLALTGSPAIAKEVNEKDQQTARSAWARAVSLAKERNAGNICEAEAYQSTILSELGLAVKLSPYLQNEVAKARSASAKALRQALAGSLMLSDLIGRMSTPKQVAEAIVDSVWYSKDGGAGGSLSILKIEKNKVRELVLGPDQIKRHPVLWTYSFDATTRELTLRKGATTRRYKLGKDTSAMWYKLTNSNAGEVGYVNEPDDCSA
jgi:hypothetical protein